MAPSPTDSQGTQYPPKRTALVAWLVVVPVIFITLACCGQLALLLNQEDFLSADTRSQLRASYLTWPYSEIPPINIAALLEDLQKEQDLFGTPGRPPIIVVEEGEVVNLPTSTTGPIALISPTPTPPRQTPTTIALTRTPTVTQSSTNTQQPTETATPPPTVTPSPSLTNTWPPPPPPTSTDTQEPPPPPSQTPTQTPVTPSPTPVTPTPTDTDTPVAPTPTYAPVRPIAENNGESEIDPLGRGCLAYFGYRNDNPTRVIIPLGERNYFSQPYVFIDPDPPPSTFEIERVSPAFMVVWNTGEQFIWYLDGRQAVAGWCALPLP